MDPSYLHPKLVDLTTFSFTTSLWLALLHLVLHYCLFSSFPQLSLTRVGFYLVYIYLLSMSMATFFHARFFCLFLNQYLCLCSVNSVYVIRCCIYFGCATSVTRLLYLLIFNLVRKDRLFELIHDLITASCYSLLELNCFQYIVCYYSLTIS